MKINNTTNIIKTICAFMVIFSHSFPLSKGSLDYLSLYSNGILDFGGLAVGVFFFFSGYYITKSIKKNGTKNFFKKRLLRLIPTLAIVILITTFVIGPMFTSLSLSDFFNNRNTYLYLLNCFLIPIHSLPGVFTNNIFGSTINGALWTLSVEFLCYVFLYIIYKLNIINERKYPFVLIVIIILCLIGNQIFKYLNIPILCAMIRPYLIFSVGILISVFEGKIKIGYKSLIISVITFAILLSTKNLIAINFAMIVILPYFLYATILLFNNLKIKNPTLLNISYQLYLVGFPIQQIIVHINGGFMNPVLNFLYSSIISIVVAYILSLIEKQIFNIRFVKK